MGYWNSRGLRGSTFEEFINFSIELYRQKGLATIQKIPTPITPVQYDKAERTIGLAYFGQKSTVDYIGAVQGVPVCFDAKETSRKSLPIQNIHQHQIEFMKDFRAQNGLAFLIVRFTFCNEVYLLPFEALENFWDAAQKDGRKSVPYDAFDKKYMIKINAGGQVHFLEAISAYYSEIAKK